MINFIPERNVYPTGGSETLGQMAGPLGGPQPAAVEAGSGEVDEALRVGGQASPFIGALVFLILLAVTMWVMHRFGKDGEFANIKATAYNALVVGWLAVLSIPVYKFLFTKVKLPGVSSWVHAA